MKKFYNLGMDLSLPYCRLKKGSGQLLTKPCKLTTGKDWLVKPLRNLSILFQSSEWTDCLDKPELKITESSLKTSLFKNQKQANNKDIQ